MSLINRMLRDLSTRTPESADVMQGVQVRGPAPVKRSGGSRALLLIVLVAGFSATFWFFMPRGAKKPAAPAAGEAVVASPVPAAAPAAAVPAPQTIDVGGYRMDATLSTPIGAPARRPKRTKALSEATPGESSSLPAKGTALRAENSLEEPPARPKPASARDVKEAQARYAEARRALAAGDDRTAEVALMEALALDPKLHPAREDLGTLRVRQGRLAEAERLVSRGLQEEPDWIGYRRLLARLELARNQNAEALARLEPSRPLVNADPEYHGLLAAAYQRLERHNEAMLEYQALIELQPNEGRWWAGLGISREARGDRSGALEAYGRARALGNLDPRIADHIKKRIAALQPAG